MLSTSTLFNNETRKEVEETTETQLPFIVCVPTGVIAKGTEEISKFERNFAQVRDMLEQPIQVVFRSESTDGYVEESILNLRHDQVIDWLLPGLKPTNRCIVFPLLTISKFNEQGELLFKRFYWDQASILKQVGILPNVMFCKANHTDVHPVVLDAQIVEYATFDGRVVVSKSVSKPMHPAAGLTSEQAHAVHNTPRSHNRPPSAMSSILGEEEASKLKTRLFTKSQGSSDIFSSEPLPLKTSIPINPLRFKSQISLGEVDATHEEYHSGKKMFADGNASHFSLTNDEKAPVVSVAPSLHGMKMLAESQEQSSHQGKKLFSGSQTSHFTLGGEAPSSYHAPMKRRDPNARSEEHLLGTRASSRVLRAPGGGSSIQFG